MNIQRRTLETSFYGYEATCISGVLCKRPHDDHEEPQSLDNQHKNLDVEEDKRKKGKDVAMDDVAEEKGDQSMGENIGYYHEEK
ncbi:hypothetical protein Tco_0383268 [Tanacetum coccineum]